MSPRQIQYPDVDVYLALIDRFIDGSINAAEFEHCYLRAVKSERRILGDPVSPILQGLFEDVDAYVGDPDLRDGPDDLDEEQLHECASRARQALRDLGYL